MKKEIALNVNRKDFENHFFGNNSIHWIKSPLIKRQFVTLLISFVVLLLLAALYLMWGNKSVVFFGGFIFLIVAIDYLMTFYKLKQYKREINQYIDKQERYNKNTLILSDNYFSITQDEDSSIEKWSNFQKVNISETSITLEGETNYFIPCKSMDRETFEEVKSIICEKLGV